MGNNFIIDSYKKNRGGWSRILLVSCTNCNFKLFYYQKDGQGPLKRCYLDRICLIKIKQTDYVCASCKELLGIYQPYKKEFDRPAIRWLSGAVNYKIVPIKHFTKIKG